MKDTGKDRTPLYFRYSIHLIRFFPDFDVAFMKPVRRKAVALLHLEAGDRVLDVGCGPGGSFPYLVDAVGPTGEVVGVEISPEVAINARRRISRNQWSNVQVIEASAQTVDLKGPFDGLLMFAAPDAYASESALRNILPHLRDRARVALFGAKLSRGCVGRLLNPLLRLLFNLSFTTTPRPDYEPWRMLESRLDMVDVEEYFFGLMFLASGSLARSRESQESI